MCINCVQSMHPNVDIEDIEYTSYEGKNINLGQFNSGEELREYIKEQFNGSLPIVIDCNLVGTYKIKEKN